MFLYQRSYQRSLYSQNKTISVLNFLLFFALLVPQEKAVLANGRFPSANQISIAPHDSNKLALRTTYGLLLSRDHGSNWDWICEQGMHYGGVQDPTYAMTKDGSFVISAFEGLVYGSEHACDFRLSLSGSPFSDLTLSPSAPEEVFAIQSVFTSRTNDGVDHFQSKIFKSIDNGRTYTDKPSNLNDFSFLETVEVSRSNPLRIYLSGKHVASNLDHATLFRSDDGGVTFASFEIPLLQGERSAFVSGVDPENPNLFYVRTEGSRDTGSRLLVSQDGGEHFSSILSFKGSMLGFALSEDGKTIWAGGMTDRLHRASSSDFNFSKISDVQIQCLTVSGQELWACSNELSGFVAGLSLDQGEHFTKKLGLSTLRGPLECHDGSASQCKALWPAQASELGISLSTPNLDAGKDAQTTPLPSPSEPSGSSCHCNLLPAKKNSSHSLFETNKNLLGTLLFFLLFLFKPLRSPERRQRKV